MAEKKAYTGKVHGDDEEPHPAVGIQHPGEKETVFTQLKQAGKAPPPGEHALADAAGRAALPPDDLDDGTENKDGHRHVHKDACGEK